MSYEGPLPIKGPYSGYGMIACASFFIVFCTILVGLRLYAKYLSKTRWGWDDWLLVPCLLLALLFFSTTIYMTTNLGAGYHIADVLSADPSLMVRNTKVTVLLTVNVSLVLALPRCCILAAYLRFFCSRTLRILTWILMGLTIANATTAFIISFAFCVPLQGAWDPNTPAVCIDTRRWWAAATIPVAVMDVMTMALPVSTFLQLKRPLHERMALLATFLAYGFATVAEIIRIVIFFDNATPQDPTWSFVHIGIASVCEVSAYIIACCIPGLRSLWKYRKSQDPATKQSAGYVNMNKNVLFEDGPLKIGDHNLDAIDQQTKGQTLESGRRLVMPKAIETSTVIEVT